MAETRAQREARRRANISPRGGRRSATPKGPFDNGSSKERVLQRGARGEREKEAEVAVTIAIAIPATQTHGSWGQVTH